MSRRQLSRAWKLTLPITAACFVFTFTGFFGEHGWLLDLTSHFRPQYLLWLAITALILAFRSNGKCPFTKVVIIASSLGAAVNFALIIPYWIAPAPYTPSGSVGASSASFTSPLKFVSSNVNSYFGDPVKVEAMVREENPDVLLLTEVTSQWLTQLAGLKKDWPYECAEPREDSFGILLLSKRPFDKAAIVHLGHQGLPSVRVEFLHEGQRLTLLGTHPAPPKSPRYAQWRNEDMADMPGALGPTGHRMIVGDLNSTVWCAPFRKLVRETGLEDAAHGFGWCPTWPTFFPPFAVAIDHALVSSGILVTEHRLGSNVDSDHWPQVVTIRLP